MRSPGNVDVELSGDGEAVSPQERTFGQKMGNVIEFPTGKIIERDNTLLCKCGSEWWVTSLSFIKGEGSEEEHHYKIKEREEEIECVECGAVIGCSWT